MKTLLWTGTFLFMMAAAALFFLGTKKDASSSSDALPRFFEVPAFELTDETSQPFTTQSLAGQVWIADFIFTRCPGACPVMTGEMQKIHHTYLEDSRLNFVSISVDPEFDTPEVLSTYAREHEAAPGKWVFLTGPIKKIHDLAVQQFRLGSLEKPADHSSRLVLMDGTSTIRGYYDAFDEEAMTQLRTDLAKLLKEAS